MPIMLSTRPIFGLAMPIRASRRVASLPFECRRRAIHSSITSVVRRSHDYGSSTSAGARLSQPSCRYASSTTATALKPASSFVPAKSPSSTLPTAQVLAKLNPPEDTYAPPLSIPSKKAGQNSFKYLFQCGKLYVAFYKKGISNVIATAKLAKKLGAKAAHATAKQDAGNDKRGGALGPLTRAEYQIVRRSRRDILRLPGFAILVLIFGEWMPLIALYITGLIPEACRIPKQVDRTLRKLEARRAERQRRLALDAARLVSRDRKPGVQASFPSSGVVARPAGIRPEDVEKMDFYTLLSLSTKLDVHGAVWDWLFVAPPKPLLKRGVRQRLEYLRRDDGLIGRDGGVAGLSEREVRRACVERGIGVLGRSEEVLRRRLAEWFRR